ncbi:MAG: AAA family ATPase [Candidatus Electrothrix aestuarii]|uniref:AAA family ATPase n=1 Tax=Candidatus Electrothrix aestuarii TaxID=3062594 RepID=A0AAU8LXQ9_9BACT
MVLNSNKSLVFAGHLAVTTNKLTLAQLLVGPSVARSVAILSTPAQQELTENNILLSIYYPSKKEELDSNKSTVSPQLDNNTSLDDWVEMNKLSQEPLTVRLKAARSWLEEETQYEEKEQYVRLLILLQKATEGNLHHLAQYNIVTSNNNSWLNGGWEVVKRLQINCKGMFDDYLSLTFKEARKEYLRKQGEKTSGIDWLDLPWFWADIGQEIAEIWRKIYHQKENDIAELLYFNITLETKTIGTGNTNLSFQLSNTSGIIAKSVRIHLKKTIGIVWESNDINLVGLFQGHDSAKMNINLVIEQPGRYIINGTLTALDLDERSYEWPVNFVLHADEKGQPYQLSEKQYYIVGPRLSSDLLFVGRKQLLDDISLLWKEPANKEALLLIGLRRMGKSSLLEKIRRDGINDKVVPLLIDLQGKATQYAFFQAVAEAMAVELNCDAPVLEQNNPGPAFEQFLRSLTPQLAGRYILLMIDEANFFARRDYGELPHLLRSLMQAPDVPLLLLFCGTYELRQGARDYDSILYNTTRTKNVSYFNPTESAEVLTRPVRDFLEYDPQALQLAFQLTHGHPLLLQALGDQLIQTFNDTVLAGKERSNYVTYGDMEQAGKQLSQKENPAFGNYWEDADTAQQKVLAVMAASLDETSRKRGSLEYLLAQAAELRIPLERREGFKALDQLTQEEQLTYADGGYSFMVALYRRWIFWYYPPERFRESL